MAVGTHIEVKMTRSAEFQASLIPPGAIGYPVAWATANDGNGGVTFRWTSHEHLIDKATARALIAVLTAAVEWRPE